jgi:hypothetical protein
VALTLVGAQMIKLLLTLFIEPPRRVLPGTRASAIGRSRKVNFWHTHFSET